MWVYKVLYPKRAVSMYFQEAAKLAKLKGKVLQKGMKPVNVFWKQERKRTSSSSQGIKQLLIIHSLCLACL